MQTKTEFLGLEDLLDEQGHVHTAHAMQRATLHKAINAPARWIYSGKPYLEINGTALVPKGDGQFLNPTTGALLRMQE